MVPRLNNAVSKTVFPHVQRTLLRKKFTTVTTRTIRVSQHVWLEINIDCCHLVAWVRESLLTVVSNILYSDCLHQYPCPNYSTIPCFAFFVTSAS